MSLAGLAAQNDQPKPNPVQAPVQPSAALLEFVGDWNEDERQLIGMDKKADKSIRKQNSKEMRRAP